MGGRDAVPRSLLLLMEPEPGPVSFYTFPIVANLRQVSRCGCGTPSRLPDRPTARTAASAVFLIPFSYYFFGVVMLLREGPLTSFHTLTEWH